MSFKFEWPRFEDKAFEEWLRGEVEMALNKGTRPSNICDRIKVVKMVMGTIAPELDIMEIGELTEERFRGIFKFNYLGDAKIVLRTKVQVNPLTSPLGLASAPLIVPVELSLSEFRIRGIFVLIVSLLRGVTLSFKNDPLEGIKVNSTFDTVPIIQKHLQNEIEQRLRHLFREEIPLLIHQYSQDPLRHLAECIPEPFRFPTISQSPPPTGYFRHARYSLPTPVEHRITTSPVPRSPSSLDDNFIFQLGECSNDVLYYYHSKDIIHRVSGAQVTFNPLLEKIELRRSSPIDDLIDLLGSLPLLGEDLRDWLESGILLPQEVNLSCKGLADPLILNTSNYSRQPSSYQPSVNKSLGLKMLSFDNISVHDPDEFRPPINYSSSSVSQSKEFNNLFNPSNLKKFALKGKLKLQLRILRQIYESSSPVGLSSLPRSSHSFIHRSFISSSSISP